MKRGIKILSFLVLAVLAVPLSVFAESSMTWRTDSQWQTWDRNHVAPVGGDQGIQLTKDNYGQFYDTGTAEYEYSVGSTTKWKNFTAEVTNSSPVGQPFIWAAMYRSDLVSQINPRTGTLVKNWAVGDDPSRTAVGCHNDAWVANRTGNSISHITPSSDSVKTNLVGSPLSMLRSISIKCATTVGQPDYLFVGGNGYLIKINADKLDALSSTSEIIGSGAQVGNTIDVRTALTSLGVDGSRGYSTYGSVFGGPDFESSRYLYLANYAGALPNFNPTNYNTSDTYRIDTLNWSFDNSFLVSNVGFYIMANDSRGNVWRDGGCHRISPSGVVTTFCELQGDMTRGVGVSVMRINNNTDRVFYNNYLTNKLCYFNITKAHTATPIKGTETCVDGGGTMSGALGYDTEKNIWFIPRNQTGALIRKFTASSNYTSRLGIPNSILGENGNFYTYSDFIGNALENSFGTLSFSFSPDGGTNWFTQAELLAGTIPDSTSLKIKASFTGASTSPILKSITLGYESQFGNLGSKMLKSTYRTAEDRNGEKNPKATFEKGETVYVRIKTFEGMDGRSNLLLTDRISGNVESPADLVAKKFVYKDGAKCANINNTVTVKYLSDSGKNKRYEFTFPTIKQGETCIDYEYKLKDE